MMSDQLHQDRTTGQSPKIKQEKSPQNDRTTGQSPKIKQERSQQNDDDDYNTDDSAETALRKILFKERSSPQKRTRKPDSPETQPPQELHHDRTPDQSPKIKQEKSQPNDDDDDYDTDDSPGTALRKILGFERLSTPEKKCTREPDSPETQPPQKRARAQKKKDTRCGSSPEKSPACRIVREYRNLPSSKGGKSLECAMIMSIRQEKLKSALPRSETQESPQHHQKKSPEQQGSSSGYNSGGNSDNGVGGIASQILPL